jgi:hypothetical protein
LPCAICAICSAPKWPRLLTIHSDEKLQRLRRGRRCIQILLRLIEVIRHHIADAQTDTEAYARAAYAFIGRGCLDALRVCGTVTASACLSY